MDTINISNIKVDLMISTDTTTLSNKTLLDTAYSAVANITNGVSQSDIIPLTANNSESFFINSVMFILACFTLLVAVLIGWQIYSVINFRGIVKKKVDKAIKENTILMNQTIYELHIKSNISHIHSSFAVKNYVGVSYLIALSIELLHHCNKETQIMLFKTLSEGAINNKISFTLNDIFAMQAAIRQLNKEVTTTKFNLYLEERLKDVERLYDDMTGKNNKPA